MPKGVRPSEAPMAAQVLRGLGWSAGVVVGAWVVAWVNPLSVNGAFPNPDSVGVTCTAWVDAWLPVVPTPSAAVQAADNRAFTMPPSIGSAPPAEKAA